MVTYTNILEIVTITLMQKKFLETVKKELDMPVFCYKCWEVRVTTCATCSVNLCNNHLYGAVCDGCYKAGAIAGMVLLFLIMFSGSKK